MPNYIEGFTINPNPRIPLDDFISYIRKHEGDEWAPHGPKGQKRFVYIADYRSRYNRNLFAGAIYSPSNQRVRPRGIHDPNNNNKLLRVEIDRLRDGESVGESSFFLIDRDHPRRLGLYLHPAGALGVQGLIRTLTKIFADLKKLRADEARSKPGADSTAVNREFNQGLGGAIEALPENWTDMINSLDEAEQISVNLHLPLEDGAINEPSKVKKFALTYSLTDTTGPEALTIVKRYLHRIRAAVQRQIETSLVEHEIVGDDPSTLLKQAGGDVKVRGRRFGATVPISLRRVEQMVRFRELEPDHVDDIVRRTRYDDLGNSPAFELLENVMEGSPYFAR